MAQNDMYVVMYRILAYLYDCMKRGEVPERERYSAHALGVPEPYWSMVMSELVSHRFVADASVSRYSDGSFMVFLGKNPYVTMEGVEFAQENSMMGKAKRFLQDAKSAVPFI